MRPWPRLLAELIVFGLLLAWYAYVLWVTWPAGLAHWPLWVLAFVMLRPLHGRAAEWLEVRAAGRRNDYA